MTKLIKAIKNNIRRTYKNKLCALALIIIGIISMNLETDGGTIMAFMLIIGVPLFFSKQNHIC